MTKSQQPDHRPPVVVVTGPTAAGKTPIAIEIAQRFGGEIINADSMQVYRFMDIGTAKASPEQRAQAAHHLLDVVTPDAIYSAGRYAADARKAAEAIHARGKFVVLTGGTGLYIRAFLEGLLEAGEANLEIRQELEEEHAAAVEAGDPNRLHRALEHVDANAAERIHPNDTRRIIRALEIERNSGSAASQLRDDHGFADRPFRTLHLALDPGRGPLVERINRRCEEMIEGGLLQEARGLRDRGYAASLRPMQAIGYRHVMRVVDGVDTLENALEVMRGDTRRFARRQRTWLRKVPEVCWQHPDQLPSILKAVEGFLSETQAPD
jgi:tRNA dimethylallyltransferase